MKALFITTITLFSFLLLSLGTGVSATVVENHISTESDTGGNSAGNGATIDTPAAKAQVNVETIIGGETVEDIHETHEGDEPFEAHKEFSQKSTTNSVSTKINISVNATTSKERKSERISSSTRQVGSTSQSVLKPLTEEYRKENTKTTVDKTKEAFTFFPFIQKLFNPSSPRSLSSA